MYWNQIYSWTFLLISTLICSTAYGKVINMVLLAEEGFDMPVEIVPKAASKVKEHEFKVSVAVVKPEATKMEICQEIFKESKQPTFMLDTTQQADAAQSKTSNLVKELSKSMGIPTISTTYGREVWGKLDDTQSEYLMQMPPPGDTLSVIIRDIVQMQKMSSAAVLYDDSFVMEHTITSLLSNLATKQNMKKIKGDENVLPDVLEGLLRSSIANFFVMGTIDTLNTLVKVIKAKSMFERQFAWIFITKDEGKIEPCGECVNKTLLVIRPKIVENEDYKEYEDQSFQTPQKVDGSFYYDLTKMIGTVLGSDETYPETLNYPECSENPEMNDEMKAEREKIKPFTAFKQNTYTGAYGKFMFKGNDKNGQEIKLDLDKTSFDDESKVTVKNIGTWQAQSPSKITLTEAKGLEEFQAVTMYRIVTIIQPPFVYRTMDENNQTAFEGYCIDLINFIKDIVKFEYTIYEVPDGEFGSMSPTLEWSGMIGELKNKSADIALGPLSVMAERETVVDFTVPYYDLVGISILMKKPQVQSSLFKFLTVLETNVWGCILGAYFFTSFLMYLFDRLSPYSYHNNQEKYKDDDEKRDFNIKECMWFCMTSLTPQGGGEAPRNLSGRLVAATWWLFGFIIIASYTANLAAFLTVSRLDSTIESLDDLAKQYKIKYAPQEQSAAKTYFERMAHIEERFYEIWKNMSLDDTLNETERAKLAVWDYPVSDKYTKIWWTMQETGFPKDFEEGVKMVQESKGPQDGFAFIADSTRVKYAVMTNCDLIPVGNEFSRKPLALAVQQGSPLKDKLSSAILKLLNQRKLESLKEKWWNKNPYKVKCDDADKQSDGISIANIGGVFIVIFIGVVLACITLAIEYWYYKQKKKSTRVVTVKEFGHSKETMKR